jgi:membrane-bound serine protease (ClpP class)
MNERAIARSILACFILAALLGGARLAAAQTTQPTAAAVVVLRGQIDDFERDALFKRFREARATGAQTIILQIDTYGGLVTAGLDISRFIKQQTGVRTIAYVHDKAISAGAMIALACDEIVMVPSATLGDCAPIAYRSDGSLESMPPAERAKAESPILADFRDSAVRNGYDVLLAESMVAVDRVVHYVQDSGGANKRFVDDAMYKKLIDEGWTAVPGVQDPVDPPNQLLTVSSREAEKVGLSKGTFASVGDLAAARNLSVVTRLEPGVGEQLVEMLANPIARLLFIVIFVVSLKIALSTPGHGAPEAIALLSLGLLIGMPMLTGYAAWWEIVLIFAGLALLAFEIFVFPGHFVSAIAGVAMILVGLVATFVGSEPRAPGVPGSPLMPNMAITIDAIQRGLLIVTVGLICSLLLWVWLNRFLPKIPYFNRIVLAPPGGDPTLMGALGADLTWPLVGAAGKAVTELKPGGSAEFLDSTINDTRVISVVSDSGYVRPGSDVMVTESRGNRVVVRPRA